MNHIRSPSLTSLTFLNRLRVVGGKSAKPAIAIFENQNLQAIFDWNARGNLKLKIKTGYVQIFNNILLCKNETRRLQDILDRTGMTNDLVQNNGGRNKCVANTIETIFHVVSHDTCTIRWKEVITEELRFDVYIIQYVSVEVPVIDEATLLERDSCSSHGWQHVFVKSDDWRAADGGWLEFNLTALSQYTTYAFLVQTYQYGANELNYEIQHNNTVIDGAISQVKTFVTKLKVPSRIKKFKTYNKTSTTVSLQWSVAGNEDPAITAFYLDIVKVPFNLSLTDSRDYCANPIDRMERNELKDSSDDDEKFVSEMFDTHYCCEQCCKARQEEKLSQEAEDSNFEADLMKFSDHVLRKDLELPTKIMKLPNFIDRIEISRDNRQHTVINLDPFSAYTFHLRACSSVLKCSESEQLTVLTEAGGNASFDRVELTTSSYDFESPNFNVRFEEPALKNGAIISYIIEIREVVGNDSIFLFTGCITRLQHETNDYK